MRFSSSYFTIVNYLILFLELRYLTLHVVRISRALKEQLKEEFEIEIVHIKFTQSRKRRKIVVVQRLIL